MKLGVIGAGGRGTYVMTEFQKDMGLRVGAICDVYEPNLERALGVVRKAQSEPARAVRRYQELLADRSIDAVLIATPEHWHHRMVLDALAAGKDVYVEKPLCQTPEQGVELVAAERASQQIVQVGMQRRSYDLYKQGREVVAAGTLGNVRMVRCWWLNTHLAGGPGDAAGRQARLGAVAGSGSAASARCLAFPAMAALFGLLPAASSPTRARMSSTASTC